MSSHSFPALPAWPKNMMNKDVKSAFGQQSKVITSVGQGNVSPGISDTQGNSRSVLQIREHTHPFTTRNENSVHPRGSAKPVSSAVRCAGNFL